MPDFTLISAPITQEDAPPVEKTTTETQSPASAPHGFDPLQPSWGLWFWSLITFLLLFLLLTKFAWKPIVRMVEEREKKIRGDIDTAERARADAEATLKRYETQLAEAAMKARETVEAARVRAEQAAAEIAAQAKVDAEAILTRARTQIESDKQKALGDIKASVIELSMAITREVVKRTAAQEEHAAVANELMKRMKDVA